MKESLRISQELLQQKKESPSHSVGANILLYTDQWEKEKTTIYVSFTHENYEGALNNLFESANHFQCIQLVLLIPEKNHGIPQDVVENCVTLPHHSLIQITDNLKGSLDVIVNGYEKYQEPFNTIHITDGSQDFLSSFRQFGLNGSSTYATNYTEMGCQIHLTPSQRFETLDNNHFDYYRLGEVKNNKEDWEPILRNHHICLFDANSLKKSELDAKQNHNPSGFTAEQAIQLIRYAMVSPNMSFLFLYHVDQSQPLPPLSATWVSQAFWYAVHGAENRAYEKPFNNENLLEFLIDITALEYPLSFLKSKKTGRWWVKIPTTSSRYTEHVFLPCTESDFRQSREGRLPNRIVKALSRVQDVSKS